VEDVKYQYSQSANLGDDGASHGKAVVDFGSTVHTIPEQIKSSRRREGERFQIDDLTFQALEFISLEWRKGMDNCIGQS
jgi:ABC-type Fe2+-enterobactin transport system substrate-binding protein